MSERRSQRSRPTSEEGGHGGGGEGEFALFYAADGDEFVGEFAEFGGRALDEEDFHVVVMLEVDVHGSDDHEVILVLDGGEAGLEAFLGVIVNEVDGAGDRSGAVAGGVLEEAVAGEGGDGLGTAGVAAAGDHDVEFVEQALGKGDGEAGELVGLGAGHCEGVGE